MSPDSRISMSLPLTTGILWSSYWPNVTVTVLTPFLGTSSRLEKANLSPGAIARPDVPSLYESCEATDEATAVIRITQTTSRFPAALTLPSFSMQSPTAMEEYGADAGAVAAPYRWVVDPVDGTTLMAKGMPGSIAVLAVAGGVAQFLAAAFEPHEPDVVVHQLPHDRLRVPRLDQQRGCRAVEHPVVAGHAGLAHNDAQRLLVSVAAGAHRYALRQLDVQTMATHYGEVTVPLRRSTQNHIGTVHAIAVCNGLEAAMGLLAEATVPPGMRWLPKGMDVEYLAKADSEVTCVAESTTADWDGAPDVPVTVTATRLPIARERTPAAITVITRAFFLMPERELSMPEWVQRGLRYAPLAALAAVVALLPIAFTGFAVARWEGGLFLVLYLAYTGYVLLAATEHELGRLAAISGEPFCLPDCEDAYSHLEQAILDKFGKKAADQWEDATFRDPDADARYEEFRRLDEAGVFD